VLQHLPKAGTVIDAISTADGLVVILGNKGEACTLGVSLDGSSLTLIAILIGGSSSTPRELVDFVGGHLVEFSERVARLWLGTPCRYGVGFSRLFDETIAAQAGFGGLEEPL
jgi:hypothetical protein